MLIAAIPFAGNLFTPSEESDANVFNYILSKDFLIITSIVIIILISVIFYWQIIKRLLIISPFIIIISGIIGNLTTFSEMNEKYPTQLNITKSYNLKTQLLNDNNPYHDTFGIYYFLEPYLNGKTISIYGNNMLKEKFLKLISKVNEITHEKYQYQLSTTQVNQLLKHQHKRWDSTQAMDLVVVTSINDKPHSKIYLFTDSKTLYVLPTHLKNHLDRSY